MEPPSTARGLPSMRRGRGARSTRRMPHCVHRGRRAGTNLVAAGTGGAIAGWERSTATIAGVGGAAVADGEEQPPTTAANGEAAATAADGEGGRERPALARGRGRSAAADHRRRWGSSRDCRRWGTRTGKWPRPPPVLARASLSPRSLLSPAIRPRRGRGVCRTLTRVSPTGVRAGEEPCPTASGCTGVTDDE
jgi:hypothetical protein